MVFKFCIYLQIIDVTIPPFAIMIIFFTIVMLQFGVQFWKRISPRSYNLATLFLMWLFPGALSILALNVFWRFFITWVLFTCVTAYLLYLASRPVLSENTPRFLTRVCLFNFLAKFMHGFTWFMKLPTF